MAIFFDVTSLGLLEERERLLLPGVQSPEKLGAVCRSSVRFFLRLGVNFFKRGRHALYEVRNPTGDVVYS